MVFLSPETGKKQLRIFVGFGWIRPEWPRYSDKFTMMCKNLFGNTAINIRINHELDKSTLNACTNGARINRKS